MQCLQSLSHRQKQTELKSENSMKEKEKSRLPELSPIPILVHFFWARTNVYKNVT